METSNKTARELFEAIQAKPTRPRFGFGAKPVLVNIDLQKSYTAVGEFATAYETDPKQMDHVNELADLFRAAGLPVVWTYVA
jgi:maleamate amidohydrolase